MALILNNSFFKMSDASFALFKPESAPLSLGEIYRVVNSEGTTTDSLSYTKIDGSTASTGNLTSGSIAYILAVSGSLTDNAFVGAAGQLAITTLLITSSVDITPTFTEQLITTTGAGTWTKPDGVTEVIVECWGAGGAGGGVTSNPAVGAGGGGGQYSRKYIKYSSPSVGISYSIGTGGVGTQTGTGASGGDTTWNTNVVVAKGGTGGQADGDPAIGNNGGLGNVAGSIGDVIRFGQSGFGGSQDRGGNPSGGSGGVGAGSIIIAFNKGTELGGSGGVGVINSANGNPGNLYAGGGGGAATDTSTNRTGGSGARGVIRLIYR
jgi:hypothetical protein